MNNPRGRLNLRFRDEFEKALAEFKSEVDRDELEFKRGTFTDWVSDEDIILDGHKYTISTDAINVRSHYVDHPFPPYWKADV